MKMLQDILYKTGNINTTQGSAKFAVALHYINNPDGSVRWAWPVHLNKPLFLKFYHTSGKRSKLFAWLIKAIFALRIHNLVFKRTVVYVQHHESGTLNLNKDWAIFTGTIGPNRKAIIYSEQDGKGTFCKVALGSASANLLVNELSALYTLDQQKVSAMVYPEIVRVGGASLELTDIACNVERTDGLTPVHQQALSQLAQSTLSASRIEQLEVWQDTLKTLRKLQGAKHVRVPQGMLRKLQKMAGAVNPQQMVYTSMSHGDFTPWNMFTNQNKLHVYDWELSKSAMPLGFDMIHFVVQNGVLVQHKSWAEIKQDVAAVFNSQTLNELSHNQTGYTDLYLQLYFIINTVYYLNVYNQQEKWHVQINWLLKVWNEALNDWMQEHASKRQLLLMDVFDFLQDKKYAVLKFNQLLPEQLSEYADVDICGSAGLASALEKYLLTHPLAGHVSIAHRSFMKNIQVFFNDGNLLSIDMIWQLKRKQWVMHDVVSVLAHAKVSEQGIKLVDAKDTARYLALFYALNKAPIPEKYLPYGELLSNGESWLDDLLYVYYLDGSFGDEILKEVKAHRSNQGMRKLKNTLAYAVDVLRSFVKPQGMMITFSGVDGAGKSTVIERVQYNLDKKLRKKVVVLRHRPSVLPILSAFTKGKEAAEKQAAGTMPRLGKNKSMLSSLARFAYYYTDYFFGQFYIYFRYVLRGYVVLYDRYYFDFINDCRRSNIQLPSFIPRLGYRFLFKPHLNFFLYADAEVILHRKQELDATTINELTERYLKLFDGLNKGSKNNPYISIENVELNQTLNIIIGKLLNVA